MSARKTWHTLEAQAALEELRADPQGLSDEEAARRLAVDGPNVLQEGRKTSAWALLAAQLKNVLIVILLLAAGASALLGHALEAGTIGVIVLFALLLGFVQEYRAERAMEALRNMAAPQAKVLRAGQERGVPARELVPGDVVLLRAGDRVPADARLLEAVNLQIDEAALTGESSPVTKHTRKLDDAALAVGDRKNVAFGGTAVTYGRGRALVVATGMQTELGQIARMLQTIDTAKTPLQHSLDRVGRALARAAFAVVAVIVVLGLIRGQPLLEMVLFGIALAVAVVPEALPAVVTISLALGVQRMAKRNALMRRLPAVETLGSTSVICSDKTGTLTRDEMTVRRAVVAGRVVDVDGAGYAPAGGFRSDGNVVPAPEPLRRLARAAALCSDARVVKEGNAWTVQGDPTEGALVTLAAKAGEEWTALEASWPRVDEIPFTSEAKRMTTLHRGREGLIAFGKGAPEVIVESCARVATEAGDVVLDAAAREWVLGQARALADQALRVLAVAEKPSAQGREDAGREMTLLGLVGMMDPPRVEVAEAVARCASAGIRPVMITGDHPATARAVARELGILKEGRVVTGVELDALDERALRDGIEQMEVFARVSPAHKLRVVQALQEHGHVVAMTGDGVNDAPALKKADIGIAMGITGTDVSKEAAAMMLTDDNFASIVSAVEEGRGIFANIKKYLTYLLSSNLGEILVMAGAALLGMPLPLSAVQILYVNLASDGLPALALAVDPPEDDLMRRRPRDPSASLFSRPVVALILIGGAWSALVNLGVFAWARRSGRELPEAMSMTFMTLVLIQFVKAYNFRSDRRSVFHRPFANRWLNLAIAWELLLLLALLYVPTLERAFGTFPLTGVDWLVIGLGALSVMPVLELVKWLERRGWLGGNEPSRDDRLSLALRGGHARGGAR